MKRVSYDEYIQAEMTVRNYNVQENERKERIVRLFANKVTKATGINFVVYKDDGDFVIKDTNKLRRFKNLYKGKYRDIIGKLMVDTCYNRGVYNFFFD